MNKIFKWSRFQCLHFLSLIGCTKPDTIPHGALGQNLSKPLTLYHNIRNTFQHNSKVIRMVSFCLRFAVCMPARALTLSNTLSYI